MGTRPEAIKLAPLVQVLREMPQSFQVHCCSSGQHVQLLEQAMRSFGLHMDSALGVMAHDQTLASLSSRLFKEVDRKLDEIKPDAVIVQGDTTTVQVTAMCAFYRQIPVGHVEAGLRTGNIYAPFPEEFNRRVTSLIAHWHYAPTEQARKNLLNEGISDKDIIVTGNTVIDALFMMKDLVTTAPHIEFPRKIAEVIDSRRPVILVTSHRREHIGRGFEAICYALKKLALELPEVELIYPVHLNPNVRQTVFRLLSDIPNILLTEPLAYAPFVRLLLETKMIITDSGGLQEEGSALGKPVLILRESTERPEALIAGNSVLVGTNPKQIVSVAKEIVTSEKKTEATTIFGDGHAASRIAKHLLVELSS